MKNKIFNILGIATVLVTLLSLFGFSAPVAAGTQSWTSIAAPFVSRYVIWVGPIAQAKDGTLYTSVGIAGDPTVVNDVNTYGNDGVWLYKSTNGGRTWAKTTQPTQTGDGLPSGISPVKAGNPTSVYTDIQCPGPDGNMVYVTDGFDIFKSIDGGTTWIPLTNLFEKLDDDTADSEEPVGYIVSISTGFIGGSVSPSAYTFAATSTFDGNQLGTFGTASNDVGGVYVLQESVFLNPWADLEVGEDRPYNTFDDLDVLRVIAFPDFATTQGVMVVVSDYEDGITLVTTKYGAGQWDTLANDVVLKFNAGHPPTTNVDSMLLSASIVLPSDFSSNPTGSNMIAFVGIDPEDISQGDVFLCNFGPAAAVNSVSYDLNIDPDGGVSVSGMSGIGPAATASILVSGYDEDDTDQPNTWTSRNGGISWTLTDDNISGKRPTGGASPIINVPLPFSPDGRALSSCVLMSDFATSGKALVGTHGIDCGLSLTQDWGLTWNTIYFIATQITSTDDLSLATDATMYMSTDFNSVVSGSAAIPAQFFTGTATATTPVLGNADSVTLEVLTDDTDDVLTGNLTILAGDVDVDISGPGVGNTIIWLDATHAVITLHAVGDEAEFTALDDGTLFQLVVDAAEIAEAPTGDIDLTWTLTIDDNDFGDVLIGGPSLDFSTHYYTYTVSLPNDDDNLLSSSAFVTGGFTLNVVSGTVTVTGAVSGNGVGLGAGAHVIGVGAGGGVATITAVTTAVVNLTAATGATVTFSGGHTIGGGNFTLNGPVAAVSPVTTELYSLWRYSGGFWERINSWSLYGTLYPDFDFIQTTPDQAALFTVDLNTNQLYRSINKGQSWLIWGQPIPTVFRSWLVVNPTTVAVGSDAGVIYTTVNGTIWQTRQAFTNTTVVVTDIRAAGNGDWLAAGLDLNPSTSKHDINASKSTNQGVAWTSSDLGSLGAFANATKAFIGAAADYATSGVVDVTSNGTGTPGAGVYWGKIGSTFTKADSDTDDWYQGNGASGLITSPGGPGFTAEGTGMAYTDAFTSNGLERIKGRVDTTATAAGEFIPGPTGASVHGLWVAGNAVGGVALYTITNGGTVWTYTDTLNVATSGVKATAIVANTCASSCPTGTAGGTISWNAVTNANLYFVIIDTAQWTSFYDANDWAETHPGVATLTTALSVVWTGTPATTYYVSVWALKTTSSFTEALPGSFEGLEGRVLSTFGSGTSFTTPLPSPTNLSPDTTTTNVPLKPTFSWAAVPGATGYQLQISTTSDFATPIFDSGTTSPITTASYVYTGTALANNSGYYWRVRALGTTNSDWVTAVFTTLPVVVPPVTVSQVPQPTIIVTNPPAVTVTVAAPVPAPILTVTQPTFTIAQPEVKTPTYIWIIVGVGALLTLAVIILIIRTRRVV